ncbi:hypothetical protein F5I97DRAFT_1939572 [Phlebopus sp. FC_14]|nr:hypothetical protein F5I97DRAFT_1939572 [Phlebopus sp. FC_14]
MNSDATEAALGLLGLSPLNAPPNGLRNSPALPPSLVPLKRKQPSPTLPITAGAISSPMATTIDSDAISCICGLTYDDGFSIACDDCSRWCHAACFGIIEGRDVPEEWKCWVCDPELGKKVDRERAAKVQKGRVRALKGRGEGAVASTAKPVSRRKTSPGAERKQRRGSTVAAVVDNTGSVSSKKRRRVSMLASASTQPPDPSSSHTSSRPSHTSSARISASALPHAGGVNNNPDLDQATSTSASASVFPQDSYPHPSTHAHLLRVARAWRGVTALNPPSPLNPPRTHPYLITSNTNFPDPMAPDPSDSKLEAPTIPAATLLAPYTASIVPTSAYLADPLNGYAHLGMGKPQVRLVGGGWGVGVDARQGGFESESREKERKARWARCGCWPNAVMRPVICPPDSDDATSDSDTDPTTLSFALFALRDLRADEEIVLGWEWDDGHAVHMLPALMESPGMFG